MTDRISLLLLATNQLDYQYVRLSDEHRAIQSKIRAARYRDLFDLSSYSALTASDLGGYLLDHGPHIVHFTGQGEAAEGIIIEDTAENAKDDDVSVRPLRVDELVSLIQNLQDNIRLVFINVCHSKAHADAVARVIDYAVGIDGIIANKAAITFASSFYETLAYGRSVKEAFEAAKGLAGSTAPILAVREGIDPLEPFLFAGEVRRLKPILRRVIDGVAGEDERLKLQNDLAAGAVVLDEVEPEAVEEGGERTFSIRGWGDQLHVTLSSSAYQEVKQRLFPSTPGIAPPFPPFIFVGRQDALRDVKQLLRPAEGAGGRGSITVVRGWPGVGKTSLVGVIGRDADMAKMFPQGVLWTALEQKPKILSEMARWGRALGTDEILRAPTLREATAQLAALLKHRRMLLIVDDVWDTGHVVPFTEVVGEQCALMITTRMTKVAEDLTIGQGTEYVLPVLTEEDSLGLLRVLVPEIVEEHQEECRELVGDLECLPLALHVAGRLLKSEAKLGWGVTDLIREIREGARLLEAQAPPDRIEGESIPSVRALLMRSTDKLDEFTRDCFAFLGAFAPKPATFDLAAMKAVWEVDDPKPIVRKLVGHGLLEPAGSGRFQMHRILVDQAASLCAP